MQNTGRRWLRREFRSGPLTAIDNFAVASEYSRVRSAQSIATAAVLGIASEIAWFLRMILYAKHWRRFAPTGQRQYSCLQHFMFYPPTGRFSKTSPIPDAQMRTRSLLEAEGDLAKRESDGVDSRFRQPAGDRIITEFSQRMPEPFNPKRA